VVEGVGTVVEGAGTVAEGAETQMVDLPAGTLAGIGRPPTRLLYGTAEGALELLRVQPHGGRAMDGAAYLRGHAL
jgi:hypothetical protein